MRIVVIGATGATGRLVVDEALRRGHEVVAFVRDSAQVTRADAPLTVAQGDAGEQRRAPLSQGRGAAGRQLGLRRGRRRSRRAAAGRLRLRPNLHIGTILCFRAPVGGR
jgi:uncharacterized protein YbjT (DUF2867 family)